MPLAKITDRINVLKRAKDHALRQVQWAIDQLDPRRVRIPHLPERETFDPQNPEKFRRYAEQRRLMANETQEHREALEEERDFYSRMANELDAVLDRLLLDIEDLEASIEQALAPSNSKAEAYLFVEKARREKANAKGN